MSVQSSLEDLDEVTKRAKVSIPSDLVDREYRTAIENLSRTSSIKGFRTGKAPQAVIEKLHGERVRREVAGRLVSSSLQDLIRDHNIEMVGDPEIQDLNLESGADLTYTANITIFPTPEIKGYDHFVVEVEKHEIVDSDVDKVMVNLLKSKASLRKREDRNDVQSGDVVDAMVEVRVEGEGPSRAEPIVIGVGEGQLPPAVEQAMVGMQIGELREIPHQLSAESVNEKLRGKQALYVVEVKGISESILPEADDAFVKSLGGEPQTLLELRMDVRRRLEEEQTRLAKERAQELVLEQLLEAHPFMIPQPLLDEEIRGILVRMGLFDPAKVDVSQLSVEAFREKLNPMGAKRARVSVMVDCIAEKENLKATAADLQRYTEEVSGQTGLPVEQVKSYLLAEQRRLNTTLEVTRNKVLDFLMQRTEIKYKAAPAKEENTPAAAEPAVPE